MKAVVTGGAGFIGSHLADALIAKGYETTVIDNLISGRKENINQRANFVNKDIVKDAIDTELRDAAAVFHLAADPSVKMSAVNPRASFDLNVLGTFNILEACRKADIKRLVFTSTSTVYGEAKVIPTPETYPCEPISNYAASKLANEAYCASYAHSYGIKATVLRYANIFGPRSTHGVMYDFFHKLKRNPNQLEILGNGKQEKSYLYIDDTIAATLIVYEKQTALYDVFNVGSRKKFTVDQIAKLMCSMLDVKPKFTYTGGERGWVGDVKEMLLDVKKLEKFGWKERTSFEDGVRKYLNWLAAPKR